MKYREEWKIKVPWGTLVLCRWGDPKGEPVLVIHGRQDSASVFQPLLEMMPENYNFVALDMPGNGLSDPFPLAQDVCFDQNLPHYAVVFETPPMPGKPFVSFFKKNGITHTKLTLRGPKITRLNFLAAMEFAVEHLGWAKFHFIGHSMGCEQGLFYNVINPGKIMKMILLDPGPTLIRMQMDSLPEFQRTYYDSYYENYQWENCTRKNHTRRSALEAMKKYRDLDDQQAMVLLERNFHEKNSHGVCEPRGVHLRYERDPSLYDERRKPRNPHDHTTEYTSRLVQDYIREHDLWVPGEGGSMEEPELCDVIQHMRTMDAEGYLSWDNRLKSPAPQNYGNDYYYELFKTIPPTLVVAASEGTKNASPNLEYHNKAKELMQRMAKLDNYYQIDVEGSHDVHFTNPERVVPHVIKFLSDNFKGFSKL